MKHFLLAFALLTLAFPVFAETPQSTESTDTSAFSDTLDTPIVYEDLDGEFADLEFLAPEEPEQPGQPERPTTQPDPRRPIPWQSWICVAGNRLGQRFVARSFIPGQARSMALRQCRLGTRPHWWARSCHILRCFRR